MIVQKINFAEIPISILKCDDVKRNYIYFSCNTFSFSITRT